MKSKKNTILKYKIGDHIIVTTTIFDQQGMVQSNKTGKIINIDEKNLDGQCYYVKLEQKVNQPGNRENNFWYREEEIEHSSKLAKILA